MWIHLQETAFFMTCYLIFPKEMCSTKRKISWFFSTAWEVFDANFIVSFCFCAVKIVYGTMTKCIFKNASVQFCSLVSLVRTSKFVECLPCGSLIILKKNCGWEKKQTNLTYVLNKYDKRHEVKDKDQVELQSNYACGSCASCCAVQQ